MGSLASLPIVHHEGYVCPLPPNHRFKMMKFHYLYEILLGDGVIKKDRQVGNIQEYVLSRTSLFNALILWESRNQ